MILTSRIWKISWLIKKVIKRVIKSSLTGELDTQFNYSSDIINWTAGPPTPHGTPGYSPHQKTTFLLNVLFLYLPALITSLGTFNFTSGQDNNNCVRVVTESVVTCEVQSTDLCWCRSVGACESRRDLHTSPVARESLGLVSVTVRSGLLPAPVTWPRTGLPLATLSSPGLPLAVEAGCCPPSLRRAGAQPREAEWELELVWSLLLPVNTPREDLTLVCRLRQIITTSPAERKCHRCDVSCWLTVWAG